MKDLLSPAGLYCFVLLISSIYGLFWFRQWELADYNIKTYIIIMLGVLVFSLTSLFVHYLFSGGSEGEIHNEYGIIRIGNIKFVIVLIIELVTTYLSVQFYGGSLSNLSNQIISYRVASVAGDATMPSYLSLLLNLCIVNGYCCGYIAANNFILERRVPFKWILLLLLSIFNSLFAGSRGGAVSIIVATFCVFCYLYHRLNHRENDIKRKRKIRILTLIFVVLGIVFFIRSAFFLGRTMDYSPAYYLSIHLSAPLKNLDTNIMLKDQGVGIRGTEFRSINGLSLGNVGTVYTYEYIYGGIIYVIIASFLMALLSSLLYEIANKRKIESNRIDFVLVLYSYLFYAVSMIIFGTTMLDSVFSTFFLKILVGILVLSIFYNIELKGHILEIKRII